MARAGGQGRARHRRLARHRARHRAGAGRAGAPSCYLGARDEAKLAEAVRGDRGGGRARRPRWRSTSPTAPRWTPPSTPSSKAQGRLDHLVNNAGITRDNLLLRMKAEEWDAGAGHQPDRRLPLHAGRAAADAEAAQRPHRERHLGGRPHRQRRPGQLRGQQGRAWSGFTKSVAREVASRSITVNAVAPGFIETDMTAAMTDKAREAIASADPPGTRGPAGGRGRRGGLPALGRRRLRHGPGARRRRRLPHVECGRASASRARRRHDIVARDPRTRVTGGASWSLLRIA